jgi:hypothetical protein
VVMSRMLPQLEANNVRLVGIGTKINPADYLSMLYTNLLFRHRYCLLPGTKSC